MYKNLSVNARDYTIYIWIGIHTRGCSILLIFKESSIRLFSYLLKIERSTSIIVDNSKFTWDKLQNLTKTIVNNTEIC
ncbi:hypothetical protein [Abyssisolibacter fermentans]|uniref:hypothetical protein n=1 Tax=Abyssisolibacter fermentans TaxID=1766203 RepID=UPI00138EF3E3|nr:hypothetical protein [Abyssisolibacter fermentans]